MVVQSRGSPLWSKGCKTNPEVRRNNYLSRRPLSARDRLTLFVAFLPGFNKEKLFFQNVGMLCDQHDNTLTSGRIDISRCRMETLHKHKSPDHPPLHSSLSSLIIISSPQPPNYYPFASGRRSLSSLLRTRPGRVATSLHPHHFVLATGVGHIDTAITCLVALLIPNRGLRCSHSRSHSERATGTPRDSC